MWVELLGELADQRPDLPAGEVGTEAEVGADTERQHLVGVGAADVEGHRVAEHLLVAVGRRVRQQHPSAGRDRARRAPRCRAVAVRRKCRTGDVHRMISSVALPTRSGSSRSAHSWSGSRSIASIPPDRANDVVSWPAVAMMR